MNFNHEELVLMMLYNTGTRMGLFHKRTLDAYMKTKKTMKRLLSGIKKPPNTIIARNLIMHKAA